MAVTESGELEQRDAVYFIVYLLPLSNFNEIEYQRINNRCVSSDGPPTTRVNKASGSQGESSQDASLGMQRHCWTSILFTKDSDSGHLEDQRILRMPTNDVLLNLILSHKLGLWIRIYPTNIPKPPREWILEHFRGSRIWCVLFCRHFNGDVGSLAPASQIEARTIVVVLGHRCVYSMSVIISSAVDSTRPY